MLNRETIVLQLFCSPGYYVSVVVATDVTDGCCDVGLRLQAVKALLMNIHVSLAK